MYREQNEPKLCSIKREEIIARADARLESLALARSEVEAKLGDGVTTKIDADHAEIIKEVMLQLDRRTDSLRYIRDHIGPAMAIDLSPNQLTNLREELRPVSALEFDIEARARSRKYLASDNVPMEATAARRW